MVTALEDEEDAAPSSGAATVHHLTVPGGTLERLDRFLALALPHLSRARIQSLMEEGRVHCDGAPGRPAQRLKGGEAVTLEEPAPQSVEVLPQALPVDIMFQDAHLVVVNKAAGMVVHPAAGTPQGTLVNALLHHIQDLGGVGGQLRPGIVHRLDKDTSGVMVVAKHDAALAGLQAQFQARTTTKQYLALVMGVPPAALGTWSTPFGRHPVHRLKFTAKKGDRLAQTDWRVLATSQGRSALELTLHTGRTHQIRVHLSEAGWPILGDTLYGGQAASLAPRQMLHACVLGFAHPVDRTPMRHVAPLPQDLLAALTQSGLATQVCTWWEALRHRRA